MTDEQLDERLRDAFANVELSQEAEDRILANLLAAEERVEWTGHSTHSRWRWVAPASIAAVLLIGVFVGTQVRPSYGPADGVVSAAGGEKAAEIVEMEEAAEPEAAPVPAPDVDAGARSLVSNSADESYADSESAKTEHAEIVVLEDGQRFAIIDVFVDDEIDPGELDWQAATLEETGDACEAAMLEDGTCLVLFEDEDNLYLAIPQ